MSTATNHPQDRQAPALASATCSLELAAKLSNDIHEGIDCGETRAQLRAAISWWSMHACKTHSWKSLAETDLSLALMALAMLLPLVENNRSESANAARRIAAVLKRANADVSRAPRTDSK